MRYENLIMFQDTMSILESGYYVVGNERKKLKLTRTQMEAAEVYLPEDVQEITERKDFEHQHELGRCEYGCENIDSLWNMKLEEGMCFAAASHTTEEGILDNINRIRLETSSVYFNTGVLLMDLTKCRELVRRDDIFSFIRDNGYKFILPDQDVFNGLYGEMTIQIPDEIWNYDARKYSQYLMKSTGMFNEYWVIRNTAILHYCGKEKPWNSSYRFRFGNLYRHYEQLSERRGSNILKSRILPQEKNL